MPVPSVSLTPLAPGERRLVVVVYPEPTSRRVLVRQDGDEIVLVRDLPNSLDDPTRVQTDMDRAPTLYDMFAKIADQYGTPTHWCHPELEPFFPLPRPNLPV